MDAMLRGMSARQFMEWRAYDDLEPFDEERADLRAASIVQKLHNLFGRKKGEPAVIDVTKFAVPFGAQPAPKSQDEARADIVKTMDVLMLIFNTPEEQPKPRVRRER